MVYNHDMKIINNLSRNQEAATLDYMCTQTQQLVISTNDYHTNLNLLQTK